MGNAESSSSNTGGDDNREEERRKTSDLVAAGATVVAGIATAAALVAGARRVLSSSGSEEESSVPCRNQSRSSPLQFREQQLRLGGSMESSEKEHVYHQSRGSTDHHEEGNGRESWSPPPYGWYKINTDCSILPQGSGIGYIIRNHLGDMVHAEATPLVPTSNIGSAEAEAVEHGLRKAKELGFRKVWLETDHEPTVMMVNGMAKTRTKNRDRIDPITELLSSFDCMEFQHIGREANRCADHLAREAAKGRHWSSSSAGQQWPPSLRQRLKEDKEGAGLV